MLFGEHAHDNQQLIMDDYLYSNAEDAQDIAETNKLFGSTKPSYLIQKPSTAIYQTSSHKRLRTPSVENPDLVDMDRLEQEIFQLASSQTPSAQPQRRLKPKT